MKIRLNAAARLLAAEGEDPHLEVLDRKLKTQQNKPADRQTTRDKKAILDTKEQIDRRKAMTTPK
jgi:hypothetical protein